MPRITIITAMMMSIKPKTLAPSSLSLKYNTPMITAVSGSIEPSIEVVTEPMRLMAMTSVRSDSMVDMSANIMRLRHSLHRTTNSTPVVNSAYAKNIIAPKSNT